MTFTIFQFTDMVELASPRYVFGLWIHFLRLKAFLWPLTAAFAGREDTKAASVGIKS